MVNDCIGTFYFTKQRPQDDLPTIHSKGVNYINNGGGRDTYISSYAGGLRTLTQPAPYKRTFYNNLRVYDRKGTPIRPLSVYKGPGSFTANCLINRSRSMMKKQYVSTSNDVESDVFIRCQLKFNDKYATQARHVRYYQKHMDQRLSQPKKLVQGHSPVNPHKVKNLRCTQIVAGIAKTASEIGMSGNFVKY